MTWLFYVGGIAQQAQYTVLPELSEPGNIYPVARNGRNIKLEVRRMDNHAQRCVDSQCNRIRDTVVYVYHLNRKTSQPKYTASFLGKNLRCCKHAAFFQLQLNESCCKSSGIDWAIHFPEQMCHCADMILMPMCQNEPANLFRIRFQITDIRIDNIYPVHTFTGKTHAGIDNDNIIAVFKYRHVFPDFSETSQRDNL